MKSTPSRLWLGLFLFCLLHTTIHASTTFPSNPISTSSLAKRDFTFSDFTSLFSGVSFGCGIKFIDPSLIGVLISCHLFDLLNGLSISFTSAPSYDVVKALQATLPDVCTSSCSGSINTFADRLKDSCQGQTVLDITQVLQNHASEISPTVMDLLKPIGTKFTSEDIRTTVLAALDVACQQKTNVTTTDTEKWCIIDVGQSLAPVIANLTSSPNVDLTSAVSILSNPNLLCKECVPKTVNALENATNTSRVVGAYKNYIDIAKSLVDGRCLPGGGARPISLPAISSINGSCTSGFTGPQCDICQSDQACSVGEPAACSKSPMVISKSQGQCVVNEPTLKAIFPGVAVGTFTRSLPSSASASIYLDGVMQFTCDLSSCTSQTNSETDTWNCAKASCVCSKGTSMCGKGTVDLTGPLQSIKGPFELSCALANNGSSCAFKIADIAGLFPQGIVLDNCQHGECLKGDDLTRASTIMSGLTPPPSSTPVALIVGATLGSLLAVAAIIFLILGCVQRKKLKSSNVKSHKIRPMGLEFSRVSYHVPQGNLLTKCQPTQVYDDTDSASEVTLDPTKKQILQDVTGMIAPGKMTAIIGASGSGKSSLLDILAGCEKAGTISGNISLNGALVTRKQLKEYVGYVVQDDLFPAHMTVRECVEFSARCRLPESMTEDARKIIVDRALQAVGLEEIADSRIGDPSAKSRSGKNRGVSGGQRRRVSVACELVADPVLLLLDEPTSGLDSNTACNLVKQLKGMSLQGTTVCMTIHQPPPQIFALFDHVILMIPGGRVLWSGRPNDARSWLAMVDPSPQGDDVLTVADHLMDVSVLKGREILARIPLVDEKMLEISAQPHMESQPVTTVSAFTQLGGLFKRSFQTLFRDPSLLLAHWIIAVGLGALVGGFYFHSGSTIAGLQNKLGACFFLLAILGFSSLSAVGGTMSPAQRSQFLRERTGNWYRVWAWGLSRLWIDLLPLRFIPSLVMGSIAYWMIGLVPLVGNFLRFLAIIILFSTSAGAYALCIAASIADYGTASLVVAVSMLFQLLLGGLLINTNSIPPALSWIQWLSLFRYATEALAVNEASASRIIDTLQGIPVDIPASTILNSLFGFNMDSYWQNCFALLGWAVGLSVLYLLLVQWRVKERR